MDKLSKEEILKLAELSKIRLDESEIEYFQESLTSVLKMVENLKSIDCSGVEPTYATHGLSNIFREDEINNLGDLGEKLVQSSDNHQENQIKVPKVL